MAFFTSGYQQFFTDLAKNNHKDWFQSQKSRYESEVKQPFFDFVEHMLVQIRDLDPTVVTDASNCILRINRDVRFAKDKTPYNLHCTAFLSAGGKKDKSIPGLYFRIGADHVGIMVGAHGPDKNQLAGIRQGIQEDPAAFKKLLANRTLKSRFGELQGDSLKRIPPELKETAESFPVVLNKQFYLATEQPFSLALKPSFDKELVKYWQAARPLNEFLINHMT